MTDALWEEILLAKRCHISLHGCTVLLWSALWAGLGWAEPGCVQSLGSWLAVC